MLVVSVVRHREDGKGVRGDGGEEIREKKDKRQEKEEERELPGIEWTIWSDGGLYKPANSLHSDLHPNRIPIRQLERQQRQVNKNG